MSNRPTIQQVAQRAGVSRGTVDRVLNDRSYVSAEVRARVLAAIEETGYVLPRELHQRRMGAPLTLGVLLPSFEGQFQEDAQKGIALARRELEDSGVRLLLRRCRTEIPREAVELLEELRREGAAGLAVCALNDGSVERKVSELVASGVPCITFNSDLPGSRRLCYVGQDIHQAGRVAAELMSKCVPPDAVVLAAVGNLKFDGHRGRLDGFLRRMEELGFSKEQLLTAETYNDYETTAAVVSRALEAQPRLGGVYMANLSVPGCAEAIRAAGKTGRVRLICHDINETTRRLLLDGSVDFTIPQDMVQQSCVPLLLLRDLVQRGRQPDPERLRSRIQILCAENL